MTLSETNVLDYIESYTSKEGRPPTHREIMVYCGFSSPRAVSYIVEKLIAAQLLVQKSQSRGLFSTRTTSSPAPSLTAVNQALLKRARKPKRRSGPSVLEGRLMFLWEKILKGPQLTPEHRFHATRMWRFDFAIPSIRLAVEVEGGIWSGGRHTRGKGYEEDCQKYNAAAVDGWLVFRLTEGSINSKHVGPIIDLAKTKLRSLEGVSR